MKALWLVSFGPIGKSKINTHTKIFLLIQVKSLNFDIKFSLTQFDEPNVKNFVDSKNIKNFFVNIQKKNCRQIKIFE